jgi:hypothetical protein
MTIMLYGPAISAGHADFWHPTGETCTLPTAVAPATIRLVSAGRDPAQDRGHS